MKLGEQLLSMTICENCHFLKHFIFWKVVKSLTLKASERMFDEKLIGLEFISDHISTIKNVA